MTRPNHFVLTGHKITITYDSTSFTGQPLFKLEYEGQKREFMREQIRRQETEIGELVTVDLLHMPDLSTTTLTLLIPRINLDATGSQVSFQTDAILTEHLTSIAVPGAVVGAIQKYRFEPLEGTARMVVF